MYCTVHIDQHCIAYDLNLKTSYNIDDGMVDKSLGFLKIMALPAVQHSDLELQVE